MGHRWTAADSSRASALVVATSGSKEAGVESVWEGEVEELRDRKACESRL